MRNFPDVTIGLGTGAALAYARENEIWSVFEIDPVVFDIAFETGLFSFGMESAATIESIVGDARLQLERYSGSFDLIIVDAYSSESVPVHLATREAVQLYLDRLSPDSLLLIHASNVHLDLLSVFATIAFAEDVDSWMAVDTTILPEDALEGKLPSE